MAGDWPPRGVAARLLASAVCCSSFAGGLHCRSGAPHPQIQGPIVVLPAPPAGRAQTPRARIERGAWRLPKLTRSRRVAACVGVGKPGARAGTARKFPTDSSYGWQARGGTWSQCPSLGSSRSPRLPCSLLRRQASRRFHPHRLCPRWSRPRSTLLQCRLHPRRRRLRPCPPLRRRKAPLHRRRCCTRIRPGSRQR